ncbi:MAG: adenine deaminase [Clostridia bacterium]|nr:adenine deaminase [Clostridia bacterium]
MSQTKEREALLRMLRVARGDEPADLVLRGAIYLDVFGCTFQQGDIAVADGKIVGIGDYRGKRELDLTGKTVCPGFIDAHIHLESSLILPSAFAQAVIPHGTTGVVTDPHEIANVMGVDGIRYILQATEGLPLNVWVMLPSCVPATPDDESGAELYAEDLQPLYEHPRVLGLAEMMNYVGTVAGDKAVLDKLTAARTRGRRIDGHAPSLSGKDLNAYVLSGVSSDHECCTEAEAFEKLRLGQMILIREGTAARNLDPLMPLLRSPGASRCAFCSDDKHPGDIVKNGHLDQLVRRAIEAGVRPEVALSAASYHAAQHFGLHGKGAVAPGYDADLVVLSDVTNCTVERVLLGGREVWDGETLAPFDPPAVDAELEARARDTFHLPPLTAERLKLHGPTGVIGLVSGNIVTESRGKALPNIPADILKTVVAERHRNTGHVGVGLLHGYGLREGAVATSIAHDSHNIIGVGCSDEDIVFAVNRVAENHGGIVVVRDGKVLAEVPLAIAGLISEEPLTVVDMKLEHAKRAAFSLGVATDIDPFMTLSFISLIVIPSLRLNTKGLFDVDHWRYLDA